MLKVLKYILISAGLVILLAVLAAVLIPMFVDVNDYKDQISEQIRQSTGYDVNIQGEIDLSLVPWLGLSLGRTSIANPPEFGDDPMLSLDQLQVRIKFWPLFTGSLEADKIVLKGFQAGFIVNEQGGITWISQAALQDKSAP